MLNTKSEGEIIYSLTQSRPVSKEWVNGKLVETKKPAPVTEKTAPQPDLSHLPPIERLTAARKMAKQHKLSADNPEPIAPVKPTKSWWPINERDEKVKAAWLAMEAATAAYNEE